MHPSRVLRITGNQELAADGVGGFAIRTFARHFAGRFKRKTLRIGGGGDIPGAFHGTVQVGTDLLDSYNKNDLLRPLRNAGNTIGIAVDVDEDAVVGHGIDTGKINVSRERS